MTLYTIGYRRLRPDRLAEIVDGLGATLVDVRSRPGSPIPGYDKATLAARYGPRYLWKGDVLGGKGRGVLPEGLVWIADRLRDGATLLLMCAEDDPADCHRHDTICGPAFPDALHLWNGRLWRASDVSRVIAEGVEIEAVATVADEIARRALAPC